MTYLQLIHSSPVRNAPRAEPIQIAPLLILPDHAENNILEHDKKPNDGDIQHRIDRPLRGPRQLLRQPIDAEAKRQDGEVQRGIVVVDICHARHDHKGEVVQEPSRERVQARVVDVVNVRVAELLVAALPADHVPDDDEGEDAQGCGAAPVDERVAEEEVLDGVLVPGAHAEADVENGPLPPLGGKVILLIGIGDESVVRGHHGDVEVDEVSEEG